MARIDTLGHFLTDVAAAIKTKTGFSGPILAKDFDTQINSISTGGGSSSIDHSKPYRFKIINYKNEILYEKSFNKNEIITLPNISDLPEDDRITYTDYVCPYIITNNQIQVQDFNVTIGVIGITKSGAMEVDIGITKNTGLVFSINASNITSIDWGDGTTSTTNSHTYSTYGEYTVKVYGTLSFGSSAYIFNTSSASGKQYIVKGVLFGNNLSSTTLPGNALRTNYALRYVSLSPKITAFNYSYSLSYCSCLENIIVPPGVTSIATYFAAYDYSLKHVILPSTVTTLNQMFIASCYAICSLTLPASIATINSGTSYSSATIYGAYNLKELNFVGNIQTLPQYFVTNIYYAGIIRFRGQVNQLYATSFYGSRNITLDFSYCSSVPSLVSSYLSSSSGSWTSATYYYGSVIVIPDNLYSTWTTTGYWASDNSYVQFAKASEWSNKFILTNQ